MSKFEEKVIKTKAVFHGQIMDVEVDTVVLPAGGESTREIVRHSGAVALLVIDQDHKIVLTRQWRSPIGKETLEIPAGKIDQRDANAKAAAIRELNEETRLESDQLDEITSFYTSVGFTDEYMTLYKTGGLRPVTHALPQDADEDLAIEKYTLEECLAMIQSHQIEDAKTIMAVYYWQTLSK